MYINNDVQGNVYKNCTFTDPRGRGFCGREFEGVGDKRGRVKITCMYNFDDVCPLIAIFKGL